MPIICPVCGNVITDEEIEALTITEKPAPDQCKEFAEGRGE